jgi:hypothetical protein
VNTVIHIPETDLVAVLGDNGERWRKGDFGTKRSTCLHGAIRRCQPQPGDAYLVEQVARCQGWGNDWNDDDRTNWGDIRERIAHIEITDTDLADTFGPQWEHIVALVRRAAVLTSDEAQRLDAAWACTRPAREAAVAATWNAAGTTARNAAGAAVAWLAAWPATRDAAWALAIHDLIGQHGFTQEHYDLLTGPWRGVIGPVHPDDAEVAQ